MNLEQCKKGHKYILCTDEYTNRTRDILYGMLVQKINPGKLIIIEEDKGKYISVAPEFYLWHPQEKEKRITMKIIWDGLYKILNEDLLSSEDIYGCWLETAKEIAEFLTRNELFRPPLDYPKMSGDFQKDILQFLSSLKK